MVYTTLLSLAQTRVDTHLTAVEHERLAWLMGRSEDSGNQRDAIILMWRMIGVAMAAL